MKSSFSTESGQMQRYLSTVNMPRAIDIPIPGLVSWFDASKITGLNDNDPVTTWDDQSPYSNDAYQSNANNRPLYKTNILNGKPVVRFDGANDLLLLLSSYTGGDNTTVFIVANTTGNANSLFVANKIAVYGNQGGNWAAFTNTALLSGVALTSTFICMTTIFRAANNVEMRTNGGIAVTRTNGIAYQNRGGTAIGADPGGTLAHKGDIAEIIVYNVSLGTVDRSRVESYLMNKYAL